MKQSLCVRSSHVVAASQFIIARRDVRYFLNGICIQPLADGGALVIGSDGHTMCIAYMKEAGVHALNGKPVILGLGKPLPLSFARNLDLMGIELDGNRFTMFGTKNNIITGDVIDAKYPDWRAAYPAKVTLEMGAEVTFNALYVARAVAVRKAFGLGYEGVTVRKSANDNDPLVIDCDVEDVRIVVMPMRRAAVLNDVRPAWMDAALALPHVAAVA